MAFTLPPLPYAQDALAPHISAETLGFHYGKHHQGYLTRLNTLTEGKPEANMTLEDLILKAPAGAVFNCAAQTWNHTFYWNSLSPKGGGEPKGKIAEAINRDFGSFAAFKEKFTAVAVGHFASGWAWLVENADRKLEIVDTHDADCPLKHCKKPILTCDVWEHAYYVDFRNDRGKYVGAWWNLVNWDFANKNLG